MYSNFSRHLQTQDEIVRIEVIQIYNKSQGYIALNSDHKQSSSYRVSVVIPTYNRGEYISRAIESVLQQDRPAEEIIVVDDGSTDNTGEVVGRYGTKIRYIRQENAGVSATRNTGIKAACHEWIAFLDADDEWLSRHLELHLGLLERHRNLVWTTGNFLRCSCQQNKQIPDIDPAKAEAILNGNEYMDNFFHAFMHRLAGHTITMTVKRASLEEAGLFCTELPQMEDNDLWYRLAYANPKIGYISTPSAIYHMDVPESLVKFRLELSDINFIMDRHLLLALDHGCLEAFRPCAAATLGSCMKRLLCERRGKEIRYLLKRYKDLYSRYFIVTNYISSFLPRTATLYEKCKAFLCGKQ